MLSPLRDGRITGSRASILMGEDPAGILSLWRQMRGEEPEEDLSRKWAVQLGIATEPLNLAWYSMKVGYLLIRRNEFVLHPVKSRFGVTLDAFDPTLDCPIECKAVGGRESLETVIDRYQPQCQLQMACTDTRRCALSVIFGGSEPVVEFLDRDDGYIAELLERGERFLDCLDRGIEPVEIELPPPPPLPWREVDMTGSNAWASLANVWDMTKEAAEQHDEAIAGLKSLLPADVRKAWGYGVRVARDRAGRVSVRRG